MGMNAWQKQGIGTTNVPSGMTPAVSVTPPFIVRLLLGGLTSLSLVTTVFSYPSTVQRAAESWNGCAVTPEEVPFHVAPFPCRVTRCCLATISRSGTSWSLVKGFQRGDLAEEKRHGISQ